MIHVVDMYPTLAALAGAPTAKSKPLDGVDVWPTISEGKPSPRTEIVYNIEPFRAGIREGDWKLIWRSPLPAAVELYDIAQDPSEKNNVAAANPDKVAALQKRANELAATMAEAAAAAGRVRRDARAPAHAAGVAGRGSVVQRGELIHIRSPTTRRLSPTSSVRPVIPGQPAPLFR